MQNVTHSSTVLQSILSKNSYSFVESKLFHRKLMTKDVIWYFFKKPNDILNNLNFQNEFVLLSQENALFY